MKFSVCQILIWLGSSIGLASLEAAPLAYEPFDYAAASAITSAAGGSGWSAAWTQDGLSCAVSSAGLLHTDAAGNTLTVSGRAVDTAGTATTRNFRVVSNGPLNDVWISFLYRLPATNLKFEGVTFYLNTQARFSISNPSTDSGASIVLGNSIAGTSANTGQGVFGTTQFIVLHVTSTGGTGAAGLVQAFVNPNLAIAPSTPNASTSAASFSFDRVRIAGQDGSSLQVDELRIGTSYADVSPHTAAPEGDTDGDGLTNSQEAILGLNPAVSDLALINSIKQHSSFFGLLTSSEIATTINGSTVLPRNGAAPVPFSFSIEQSSNLLQWPILQSFSRSVELPDGKNFLRIHLAQ